MFVAIYFLVKFKCSLIVSQRLVTLVRVIFDNADIIAYYDLKSQKEVQMFYFGESWFRLLDDGISAIRDDSTVVVTAGQSFWFVKGDDTQLKVRWKNPASQVSVGDHD